MVDIAKLVSSNLTAVRQRMAEAAARSGRLPQAVRLVAVTKYVGRDEIRALASAGCRELGESRPQQLWQRAEQLADLGLRWHLIGHLQRNKVRRTLPAVAMIQSIDSPRLAEAVGAEAAAMGRTMDVLLEVNVSGESAKQGFAPDALPAALAQLASLAGLSIRGLMCMAGLTGGLHEARREFAALRLLAERLRTDCPSRISLEELSMGMSGDYEVAIEEGATIVRVGSALFDGLPATEDADQ